MSCSNCCFLTCLQVSQVRWSGIPISLRSFQFVVIHTVKGFSVVNEAEVDVFLNSLAFSMIQQMLAVWALVSLRFLNPACASGSSWYMYCWSLGWKILSITLLACECAQLCCSLNILWHCLSLGLEWKLTFSSPVATAEFSKLAGILSVALSQHHLLGFEIAEITSPPLAFIVEILSKAHLTSHSRMSGSRWVTTPLWFSVSLRPFYIVNDVLCTYHLHFHQQRMRVLFLHFLTSIWCQRIFLNSSYWTSLQISTLRTPAFSFLTSV